MKNIALIGSTGAIGQEIFDNISKKIMCMLILLLEKILRAY